VCSSQDTGRTGPEYSQVMLVLFYFSCVHYNM
jgi:hypothetical protein